MSLWDIEHYSLEPSDINILQEIGSVWAQKGYANLEFTDHVRLEPFLEPYDAINTEEETLLLCRLGRNGVQDEYVSVQGGRVEWLLEPEDMERAYLEEVCEILFPELPLAGRLRLLIRIMAILRSYGEEVTGDAVNQLVEQHSGDNAR